jgi:hypothetical protein
MFHEEAVFYRYSFVFIGARTVVRVFLFCVFRFYADERMKK